MPCRLLEVPVVPAPTSTLHTFTPEDPLGWCPFVFTMEERPDGSSLLLAAEGRDLVLRRPDDDVTEVLFSARRTAQFYGDDVVDLTDPRRLANYNTPLLAPDGWIHDVDTFTWAYNAMETGL